jgi:hypothetical protein
VLFLLKILKEVYLSTWSLYADNADVFGAMLVYLALHFSNVSHNSTNLAATKLYSAITLLGVVLWVYSIVMVGLVIQETIVCASVPKEDFAALLDCYQMEPQAMGEASQDCTQGSNLRTRATGTCPGLQFKSEVQGNAWLFFQYITSFFLTASLLVNVLDNVKIMDTLIILNEFALREQEQNRNRSIEVYLSRTVAASPEYTTTSREVSHLRQRPQTNTRSPVPSQNSY